MESINPPPVAISPERLRERLGYLRAGRDRAAFELASLLSHPATGRIRGCVWDRVIRLERRLLEAAAEIERGTASAQPRA